MRPVCENHFWSKGPLLETIKNGNPTKAARQVSNQNVGLLLTGTELTHDGDKPMGKLTKANVSRTSCTISWFRNRHLETIRA